MNMTFHRRAATSVTVRSLTRIASLGCLAAALCAAPAAAQISKAGLSKPLMTTAPFPIIGNDIAYDPVNQVYFVAAAYGEAYGMFVSTAGHLVAGPFRLGAANRGAPFAQYPKTHYSSQLNGGLGGFLVTWHQNDTDLNFVHAAVVAYPAGVVTADTIISDVSQSGSHGGIRPAIAYSKTTGRFLVAWTSLAWGTLGRFLDAAGTPAGPVMSLVDAGTSRDPALTWHPGTNEFGLAYAGFSGAGAFVAMKRVKAADGTVSAPTTFGFSKGTFNPDIDVNLSTQQYVMGWSTGPGASGAQLDQNGTLLATRLISSRLGTPTSFDLAFNPLSGTFLALSEDLLTVEVAAVELNSAGVPLTVAVGITDGASTGSFVPRVAARSDTSEWNISYSRNLDTVTNQVVATSAVTGPPPPPPTGPSDVQVVPLNYSGDVLGDALLYNRSTGSWKIQLGNLQGKFDAGPSGTWVPGLRVYRADWNGNGLDDLFVYSETTGAWSKINNSSTAFSYFSQVWLPNFKVSIVDLNGDRRSDVFLYNEKTGVWYTAISVGDGTAGFEYGGGGWLPGFTVMPGDFDNDGRTDFLLYHPATGLFYKAITRGNGLFAYSGGGWSPGWTPIVAELNGDGLDDVFLYSQSSGVWYRAISAGDGTRGFMYSSGGWAPGWTVSTADFNGDILTDLFLYNPGTGMWYKALGKVDGFSYTGGGWAQWATTVARLDGDIIDDVLLYNSSTGVWFKAISTSGGFTYYTGTFTN
jgi:hypothetical protein